MRPLMAIVAVIGLVFVNACANKNVQTLSPEGKVAYYGERFMSVVERAQQQTISLVGQNGITREDVTPAVQIFGQIGKAGQQLATALDTIDKSNVTADKQAAALRVREILTVTQGLINQMAAQVTSTTARQQIFKILDALEMASAIFNVIQSVSPLLPPPTNTGAFIPRYDPAIALSSTR